MVPILLLLLLLEVVVVVVVTGVAVHVRYFATTRGFSIVAIVHVYCCIFYAFAFRCCVCRVEHTTPSQG